MRFRVLGPLEAVGERGPVHLAGRRRRTLLAALLLSPGRVVCLPALVDAIWADRPPRSAVYNVRTYVYEVRRLLQQAGWSPDRLSTDPAGYRLDVTVDELDMLRFDQLAAQGRRALAAGEHQLAAQRLGLALALWRGDPLEELSGVGAVLFAKLIALAEERLAVASSWVDAQLALGHHDRLLPALRQMVAQHPLHERTQLQLMAALHRAGRTADALATYRRARQLTVEELGVEPGEELRRAHAAILSGEAPAARSGRAPAGWP